MNRKVPIAIGAVIVLLVAIALGFWYFRGEEEGFWICQNGEWVKQGEPTEPMPERECEEGEKVGGAPEEEEEVFDQAKFDRSKQIAQEAAENAPTYKFDGYGLKYESFQTLRCPNCWEFTFSFSSRYSGYGDRTGQILAQVITPHQIRVTVQDEEVVVVVTDRTYDELSNLFLK